MIHSIAQRIRRAASSIAGNDGMTLIEIMIVVTIIAIMGALVVPRLMDLPQKARVTRAKMDVNTIKLAINKYSVEHNGIIPSTEEGLKKLVDEKYLENKKDVLNDPWGRPWNYRSPGEKDASNEFEIWSLGADGKEGGDGVNADIKSWE